MRPPARHLGSLWCTLCGRTHPPSRPRDTFTLSPVSRMVIACKTTVQYRQGSSPCLTKISPVYFCPSVCVCVCVCVCMCVFSSV